MSQALFTQPYTYNMNACQVQGWPLTSPIAHRLFEELWVPLVNDTFAKGATVYMHLIGPMGKRLLHAAQMQPGLEQAPTTNAGKLKLVDTLMALINSNQLCQLKLSSDPEGMDTDQQKQFAQQIRADPLYDSAGQWQGDVTTGCKAPVTPPVTGELPVSAAPSRKLVFDASSMDSAGVSALTGVYLDGYMGFSPFIKYFPVPTKFDLPAQFRPTEERHPRWEASKLADRWLKRKDLAFEVCIQAPALQQAVNARAPEVERIRQEEYRQSKKKFVLREVSMDLRTAASKVAALLQSAIQANKKSGCHPQSIVTLSAMFKDLRAGKSDAVVHRNKNDPSPQCLPFASLQGWLCIASASDVNAMVAELYA